MDVDADWEGDPVFVEERCQRDRGHGLVVFEHAVEAEHRQVVAEGVLDALGLRQPVGDATRAEHLERLDDHNLAHQVG